MASRPFQFWEKKRSKIKTRAAKHFAGLDALSTHSAVRRSRPGVSPFISALTVARCPATFPGVRPQLRDSLSTSWSMGRRTGLSYTCRRSLKTARLFAHSHSRKFSLFSCRSKRGAQSTAPRFPRQPRQQV